MIRSIVLTERDNVATLLDDLEAGVSIECTIERAERRVVANQRIPAGHKIALATIEVGEPVVKYGEPIGLATRRIAAGDHVHVHNTQSERGRGDRGP